MVDPADGRVIRSADRSEVHAGGLWHQVFHCLIVRPAAGTVLLQQRAATKSSFPGLLDLSATGHLRAGEEPVAGVRELAEELGVDIDPGRLVPLGTRLLADNGGEGANRERMHVYLLPDDRPAAAYRPDPAEVAAVVEVGARDLLDCWAGAAAAARRIDVDGGDEPLEVTVDQLVPAVDGYWTVLLVMTLRYLAGHRPLAI